MKVIAEHEVANDKESCWDPDRGGWYDVCKYQKNRDRRWKENGKIRNEYKLPKCTLFEEWLETDWRKHPLKCSKCLEACSKPE